MGVDNQQLQTLASVNSDQLKFNLLGCQDLPLIEATIAPGAKVCAEPGRMISLPQGVTFRTIMGDGSEAGMFAKMKAGASRMFSGESIMLAEFENETDEEQTLRFGTVIPGNIVPINLQDYGGEIIGMNGVYHCGSSGLKVGMCFKQKLGAAFFGGESFILQKISGDGVVLLQGGGTVLMEELTPERPKIRVDTGCLVAFTSGLNYNIAMAGRLKSWIFGGEGMFHATIELPEGMDRGIVWIESYPYSKFISQIKGMYHH